jgi:hypothetical protein
MRRGPLSGFGPLDGNRHLAIPPLFGELSTLAAVELRGGGVQALAQPGRPLPLLQGCEGVVNHLVDRAIAVGFDPLADAGLDLGFENDGHRFICP